MPDLTGQSIGRYHILEQLGEGGMATVYKTYDTRLERNVAIKVLRIEMFSPVLLQQVLQRFEREAKSLARLSHPNIVNILDYGEHEGMPYLVMEYLPGGTLKQKLGQAIPWPEAVNLLLAVADGLAYAHEHGIIHRDVKPANILLKEKGAPVLTDFGIAKLLETSDGQTLTASGVGIGTPEYMAPEQGMGSKTIDARADIYALGIVLYEMVVGRKPYTADTPMAVVLKQISDPLPRPSQFVTNLPEGVENVLFKALAKQPDDRYQSMDEFIAALQNLLREAVTAPVLRMEPVSQPVPLLTQPAVTAVSASAATVLPQPTATVATPPVEPPKKSVRPRPPIGRWVIVGLLLLGVFAAVIWALSGSLQMVFAPKAAITVTSGYALIIPPSITPYPTKTAPHATEPPKPTTLPGVEVVPIEKMAREIPWLPTDQDAVPGTFWINLKIDEPPFDHPAVRKALAAALDRDELMKIIHEKSTRQDLKLATSLVPPEILGRDLTRQVGIPFDTQRARQLLAEGGYPNGENFPQVYLYAGSSELSVALFDAIAKQWQEHLNIKITARFIESDYYEVIAANRPKIFMFGWIADVNDPENFLQLFRPGHEENTMGFSNFQYNFLIDQALQTKDPAKRQELYIQAERILCEEEVIVIPLYFFTTKTE